MYPLLLLLPVLVTQENGEALQTSSKLRNRFFDEAFRVLRVAVVYNTIDAEITEKKKIAPHL